MKIAMPYNQVRINDTSASVKNLLFLTLKMVKLTEN